MWVSLHQQPVFEGAGFHLVGIDHQVFLLACIVTLGHEAPLQAGGKSSTTATLEARVFYLLQHIFRAQALRDQPHALVAIGGLISGDFQGRPGHIDVLG